MQSIQPPLKQRVKTTLKASASLATLMVAGAVQAQAGASGSNVTIYGLMDVGVTHLSNVAGGTVTQLDSGISATSRIGFRGNEDLGGGLSAVFQLESGILADTGNVQTPFWSRGAFVGLRSASLGTLTVGRQFDFLFTSMPPDSVPFFQGSMGAGYRGFSRPGGPPPAVDVHYGGVVYDNSIKWEHAIGAWSGGLMYGLGSENSQDSMKSAFVKYTDPQLQLALGWVKDNFTKAVFANEALAAKGFYRLGAIKLTGDYAVGKETVAVGSKARIRTAELAVDYEISAAMNVGVGMGWARGQNRAGQQATLTQPFVGARYRFSKSTAVYVMAGRNHTSDPAIIPSSVAAPGGASAPSSTDSQTVYRFGIAQRF